jgi:hypothetical protein
MNMSQQPFFLAMIRILSRKHICSYIAFESSIGNGSRERLFLYCSLYSTHKLSTGLQGLQGDSSILLDGGSSSSVTPWFWFYALTLLLQVRGAASFYLMLLNPSKETHIYLQPKMVLLTVIKNVEEQEIGTFHITGQHTLLQHFNKWPPYKACENKLWSANKYISYIIGKHIVG